MSRVYYDSTVPYVDVKVASALSIGGPVRYDYVTDSKVDDEFILKFVAPRMSEKFEDKANAIAFGKALCFAIFDSFTKEVVAIPQWLISRVETAYNELWKKKDGNNQEKNNKPPNPMQKIRVFAIGNDNRVEYVDIESSLEGSGAKNGNEVGPGRPEMAQGGGMLFRGTDAASQHLGAIHATINQNHEEMLTRFVAIDERMTVFKATVENRFNSLTEKVEHFGTRPFRLVKQEKGDKEEHDNPPSDGKEAVLSKNPKNLYNLWIEYVVGIGGQKAAKHFTRKEQGGKSKYLYYRRNIFWKRVKNCLRSNPDVDSDQVIDSIYAQYGRNKSITKIISLMLKDKSNGIDGIAEI